MDIRIREPLYITQNGAEYVVRPGTVGVEKNKVVFFYDVTRTASVGFARDFCLENPQMFQVVRTLEDKEIPLKAVAKVLSEFNIGDAPRQMIIETLKSY